MAYRFWDMDHTICDNDCDVSWKEFLIAAGRAPASDQELIDHFFALYEQNALPFDEFLAFQLREFIGQSPAAPASWAQDHFDTIVKPKIYPQAAAAIADQLAAGDQPCLLTATNEVIARPLTVHLGIPHLIATRLQLRDGVYTGEIIEPYCGGRGKVEHLQKFCTQHNLAAADVWYYGDSTSDQYVLDYVGHPVATNPMPALKAIALERGWPIQDFRR